MPKISPYYPVGYPDKPGHTKIAISFRTETFNRLIEQAKREGKTFTEMAELAITTGLFDLTESDKHEKEPT